MTVQMRVKMALSIFLHQNRPVVGRWDGEWQYFHIAWTQVAFWVVNLQEIIPYCQIFPYYRLKYGKGSSKCTYHGVFHRKRWPVKKNSNGAIDPRARQGRLI